ncbi:hypothetical protein MTO96_052163 [Rhipicephalus appendiculatus]
MSRPIWRAPIRDNIVLSPYQQRDVPRVPIHVAVSEALLKLGQEKVMVQGDKCISGAELLEKIEAYGGIIQSLGVTQGERVLCHVGHSIESFAALFGVIFAGAVAVLVDGEFTKHEALIFATNDTADYILTDEVKVEEFMETAQNFKKCFIVGGDFPGFHSLTQLQASCRKTLKSVLCQRSTKEWPAAICFTSGTTGTPKTVVITHFAYVSSITSFTACHLLQRGDRSCVGAVTFIMPPTPEKEEFWDKIDRNKVQVIFGSSTMLSSMSRALEEESHRLKSVRKVLCTGTPIRRHVGERILRHLNLTDFKSFLGCTEGLSPHCVPPPGETSFECAGFPTPNVRIKVVDVNSGQALGPGEHGEIWLQSPSVTPGYLGNDGQLRRVVDDHGWLHTGDLGYYNQDGRFFVVERLKSIIKFREFRVFPHEVEAILSTHPAVIEACVVGVLDETVNEAPTAFVVRRKSDRGEPLVTEQELVDLVASQLVYYKHLYGGVVFLEELPKTANGKTNVKELRIWNRSTHVEN